MFERRLYYHIDWALARRHLRAVRHRRGDDLQHHVGSDTRVVAPVGHAALRDRRSALIAMLVTLTLDYRTFTDKSHLIYIALLAVLVYVLFFGMVQMGARRWIPLSVFNLQPSEFAKIGVALVLAKFLRREPRRAAVDAISRSAARSRCIPLALIAKEPDLGTAVTLLPVFVAIAYLAGMRLRILGIVVLRARPRGAGRLDVRAQGRIRNPASRPFSIRRRMRKAPATSRFRRASRSDRAGSQERASGRGRKASCGFSPWPTTISFSRCWPRNRDLPASWWRSACIYS